MIYELYLPSISLTNLSHASWSISLMHHWTFTKISIYFDFRDYYQVLFSFSKNLHPSWHNCFSGLYTWYVLMIYHPLRSCIPHLVVNFSSYCLDCFAIHLAMRSATSNLCLPTSCGVIFFRLLIYTLKIRTLRLIFPVAMFALSWRLYSKVSGSVGTF